MEATLMPLLILVVVVILTISCASGPVRDRAFARLLFPPTMLCQDKLPVKILIAPDCTHGICGYTCKPSRWDEYE